MTSTLVFIYFVIVLAFIFDFINGFHDAANSIAIMVATKVLKPLTAVLWAAFFNFIAFLFFHLSVATTIGSGLIEPHIVTPYVLFAALTGAIIWNLLTWYFGLPSSSSHGLIGGLVGAALVAGGWHVLNWHGLLPVLIAIVLSPLLGLSISWLLIKLTHFFLKDVDSNKTQRWAKRAQFVAGALLSLGHGGNDAQKTMGIIAVLLFSTGLLNGHFYVPFWVIISCNFVMGLGTLIGGWRIVHTLGNKITQLTPLSGGCAATGAALTLFVATDLGIPVSTTHTVTGAILGVGSTNGWLNTHWPTIRRIMWAWILTIPAAGLVASLVMILATPLKMGLH
ncbi:inorganic phosphate transporter [Rickettsiella endosymbiont of Aleochara curtula]|jgi:PiT family inorganic phosphate transporter|uniref:inorganic phosphate transporter n=1 Tax=Rickettsiella endosymbiont of Aleochara curtula TaxID=3077936 RepID=UPI00313B57D5